MKEAKISEVEDQLSRYLALVRRGETAARSCFSTGC